MRKHNLFRALTVLACVCLGLSACDDEWDRWDLLTFDATQSDSTVPYSGGNGSITIKTNGDWSISKNVSWIELSDKEGHGDAVVTYTIPKNLLTSRSATITLEGSCPEKLAGTASKTLEIYQESPGYSLYLNDITLKIQKKSWTNYAYNVHFTISAPFDGITKEELQSLLPRIKISTSIDGFYYSGGRRYYFPLGHHYLTESEITDISQGKTIDIDKTFSFESPIYEGIYVEAYMSIDQHTCLQTKSKDIKPTN